MEELQDTAQQANTCPRKNPLGGHSRSGRNTPRAGTGHPHGRGRRHEPRDSPLHHHSQVGTTRNATTSPSRGGLRSRRPDARPTRRPKPRGNTRQGRKAERGERSISCREKDIPDHEDVQGEQEHHKEEDFIPELREETTRGGVGVGGAGSGERGERRSIRLVSKLKPRVT